MVSLYIKKTFKKIKQMRKIYLFLMMSAYVIMFSSCSNETLDSKTQSERVKEETELVKMQQDIVALNTQSFAPRTETRGFWRFFKKCVFTLLADAVGAGGGPLASATCSGVVGGVLFTETVDVNNSFRATTRASKPDLTNKEDIVFDNIIPSDILSLQDNQYLVKADSLGYYHNKTLYKIFNDPVQIAEIRDLPLNKLIDKFENAAKTEFPVTLSEGYQYDKAGMTNFLEQYVTIMNDVESLDELNTRTQNTGFIKSDVQNVITEICNGLINIDPESDDNIYFTKVAEIIQNSNVSDETKQQLTNALVIANASNHLWAKDN